MEEFTSPIPIAGAPLVMGMLLYPGLTLLDLVAPQTALAMHGTTHLLWKDLHPVLSDSGISVNPTTTFAECPENLDVLLVPGGAGTEAMMQDDEVIGFLVRAGTTARYITSVCSGSLILGMTGLLDGYKSATHWAAYGGLKATGAIPVRERVVIDRNRMSGGGGTAGIDFGLTLLAELKGEQAAKITQLVMEYAPEPPFNAGSPESAGPEITRIVLEGFGLAGFDARFAEIARNRRARQTV